MILVVLGLLLVALVCRWHFRSWLAPASCVAGFWTLALAFPLLLAPDFGYSGRAVSSLALGAVVFVAGAYLAMPDARDTPFSPRPAAASARGARCLRLVSFLGTTAGVAAAAWTVANGGFSLDQLTSMAGFLEVGNGISVQRYGSTAPAGPVTPLLLTLVYAGALAAPFVRLLGVRGWAWRFGPVVGAALFSLISTERLVLLTTVALAVGAEAVTVALRGASLGRLGAIFVVLAGAVGAFFSAVAFVRIGSFAAADVATVLSGLRSYAFGYLAGYSQWFDDYAGLRNGIPTDEPSFFAPLDYLRPGAHTLGASRGYVDDRSFGSQGGTNIFTAARALVVQLGLAGAAAFLLVAGFLTTRWYRAVVRGVGHREGPWLAAFVATVLLSSTQSFFTFTNTTVAVFLGALVVDLCVRPGQLEEESGGAPGTEPGAVRNRALSAPLPKN